MKKIAVYILLGIFLFNTMGYFVAFKLTQLQIKEAIKTDIENGVINNSVTTLVINTSDLASVNWVEEDEFEFNGNRFDVIDRSATNDAVTFYCIEDEQEDTLLSNLDNHVKNHVAPVKPVKNNTTKNIVSDDVVKLCSKEFYSIEATIPTDLSVSFLPILLNYKFALIKASFQPPELA